MGQGVMSSSSVATTILPHIACRDFLLSEQVAESRILDVGCGEGTLMLELQRLGVFVTGVEIDKSAVDACRKQGLDVVEGTAEDLPFESSSFDGIVCSVVLPYTDERRAIAEWARVLKPGGCVRATYHGIGYGVQYAAGKGKPGWKSRIYGLRMLANTVCYHSTGFRLPGFLGDTLCQVPGRLRRRYEVCGLRLTDERIVGRFWGEPVFLGHALNKHNDL